MPTGYRWLVRANQQMWERHTLCVKPLWKWSWVNLRSISLLPIHTVKLYLIMSSTAGIIQACAISGMRSTKNSKVFFLEIYLFFSSENVPLKSFLWRCTSLLDSVCLSNIPLYHTFQCTADKCKLIKRVLLTCCLFNLLLCCLCIFMLFSESAACNTIKLPTEKSLTDSLTLYSVQRSLLCDYYTLIQQHGGQPPSGWGVGQLGPWSYLTPGASNILTSASRSLNTGHILTNPHKQTWIIMTSTKTLGLGVQFLGSNRTTLCVQFSSFSYFVRRWVCSCLSWTSVSVWCTQISRRCCGSPAPSVWRRSKILQSGTAAGKRAYSASPVMKNYKDRGQVYITVSTVLGLQQCSKNLVKTN